MSKFRVGGPHVKFYQNGRPLDLNYLYCEPIGGRTCCGAYTAYKVEELTEPGRLFIDYEGGHLLDIFESETYGMIVSAPSILNGCCVKDIDEYVANFKSWYRIKKVE